MAFSRIVRVDVLRSLAAGSISGTYAALGIPFAHTIRLFHIHNGTDGDLLFSFDGTNNNLFVPAGGFVVYDLTANQEVSSSSPPFVFQIGTQVYVKQSTAPSSGSVYLMTIYGQGE